MTIRDHIKQKLKQRREQLGLTTYDIAERTGGKVSQSMVWRLENGDNERFDGISLIRVCRVLGVGVDYVVGTFDDEVESLPTESGVALVSA